jgi:outer membrane cobalamin receptor
MVLRRAHPLKVIQDPSTWKNIPPCVTMAITDIFSHVMTGDETLYDFEVKTNDRLHKLQQSITKQTKYMEALDNRFKEMLKIKVDALAHDNNERFKGVENRVKDCREQGYNNAMAIKVNNKTLTEQLKNMQEESDKDQLKYKEAVTARDLQIEEIEKLIQENHN